MTEVNNLRTFTYFDIRVAENGYTVRMGGNHYAPKGHGEYFTEEHVFLSRSDMIEFMIELGL